MSRAEALQVMLLLSALESWGLSTKNMLPDYLQEEMQVVAAVLAKIVLGEQP